MSTALASCGAQEASRPALGTRVLLIRDQFPGRGCIRRYTARGARLQPALSIRAEVEGAAPNAPREDLARIASAVLQYAPEVVVSFGGGSTIDAAKAAIVLTVLGGTIDDLLRNRSGHKEIG